MNNKQLDKLMLLMNEKNISNKELAEKTGYTEEHISRLRRGKRVPSYKALAKIAEALGVGIGDLLD